MSFHDHNNFICFRGTRTIIGYRCDDERAPSVITLVVNSNNDDYSICCDGIEYYHKAHVAVYPTQNKYKTYKLQQRVKI